MDRAEAWPWVRIVSASAAAVVWLVVVVTRWQGETCSGSQRLVNSVFALALGLPAVVAVWVLARRLARAAPIPAILSATVLALVPTVVAVVRLLAVFRIPVHVCP